jgi:thymidylate kinase
MDNDKPKIIFIEGSQGVGKSSVTKELREKLKYTTMLDLNAIGDKSFEGRNKMYKYHKSILNMFDDNKYNGMNFLCSRSYFSEAVYCELGYKSYDFEVQTNSLTSELTYLTKYYDIYFIVLTATEEELEERLNRNKFAYNKFSVENSLNQQNVYKRYLRYLSNKSERSVRCFEVPNRNINDTVDVIMNSILTNMIG